MFKVYMSNYTFFKFIELFTWALTTDFEHEQYTQWMVFVF